MIEFSSLIQQDAGFANYPSPYSQTQMRADQAGVLWKRWLSEDRELYTLTDPLQQTNGRSASRGRREIAKATR